MKKIHSDLTAQPNKLDSLNLQQVTTMLQGRGSERGRKNCPFINYERVIICLRGEGPLGSKKVY